MGYAMIWSVGIVLGTHTAAAAQSKNEDAWVAMVPNIGVYMVNVCSLLETHKIFPLVHGSRGLGVFVPKKDEDRAKRILASDAKVHPYNYSSIEGYSGRLGIPDHPIWTTKEFNIDLVDIDRATELRSDANLRGIFRGMLDVVGKIRYATGKNTYVKQVKYVPFNYSVGKGKFDIAYRSIVTIGYRETDLEEKYTMWSWDQGRYHQSSGSA